MPDVSPRRGHDALALPGVKRAPAHSIISSVLTSRFRGPFLYNELTDEEKQEAERKKKEDEEKQSNFRKVQEAREKAEARVKELEEKQRQREADEKKAQEQKLADEKKFEDLARQKETEAKAASEEAAKEKAGREAAEKELAEFKKAQQEELDALLQSLPEDKRKELPLDDAMTVPQKLKIVRHAKALLEKKPKDPVGGGPHTTKEKADRKEELLKKNMNELTEAESQELMELTKE